MRTWKDDADAADEWRRKGDPIMELLGRRDAVRMALHEAVRKPEGEAVQWLMQNRCRPCSSRVTPTRAPRTVISEAPAP